MKALVLFSGGLDSTVLATQLKAEGAETRLLSIDYGQRHARELKRAEQIAQHWTFLIRSYACLILAPFLEEAH